MADSPAIQDEFDRRLRDGETAALAELFSLHRERLWRMVNFRLDRRLAGRLSPDDVLQEAYLDAATRLEHFKQASDAGMSPFVWLRSICFQTLIDAHRRHLGAARRDAGREVPLWAGAGAMSTSQSMAIQLTGHLTSPSQAAARAEAMGAIRSAIESMDAIDREILALRHFEELCNGEAAEILGIAPKAASIRYIRAVRRLKEVLAAAGNESGLNLNG
ncbi:MAG: hypothetical protein BIFFINMI_03173 [Phycisphaerae bacterium]|nr:hypothetical protein [Phycisphaerae bacterium]